MGYIKLCGPALAFACLALLVVVSHIIVAADIASPFSPLSSNDTNCSATTTLVVSTTRGPTSVTTILVATFAQYDQPDAPVRRVQSGELIWQQPDLVQVNTTITQVIGNKRRSVALLPQSPPSAVFINGVEYATMESTYDGARSRWISYRNQLMQDAHVQHLDAALYHHDETWSTPPLCVNSTCVNNICDAEFLCDSSCDIIFWVPALCSAFCALIIATVALLKNQDWIERMTGERPQLIEDTVAVLCSLVPVLLACQPHYVVAGDWFVVRFLAGICVFLISLSSASWIKLILQAIANACRACCCCYRSNCTTRYCRALSCCCGGDGWQLALAVWASTMWCVQLATVTPCWHLPTVVCSVA